MLRLACGIVSERMTHHCASNHVLAEGEGRCRFIWIADVLKATAEAAAR